jgi:hypothetical protein
MRFSVLDATKDRINPIFCVVSHATAASDTENHGSCKHPFNLCSDHSNKESTRQPPPPIWKKFQMFVRFPWNKSETTTSKAN